MKSFVNWAKSLDWEQKSWWLLLLALCGIAAFVSGALGLPLFLCVIAWMFRAIIRHKRGHRTLTVLLIASLLLCQSPRRAKASEVCAPVIIGGAVVVVGIIVIYKFAQFCKKHLPPPNNPPPSGGGTNSPSTNGADGNVRTVTLYPTSQVESYDCSTTGWMDASVPSNPVPYQDFIILSFSSSTNLVTWTNACTVNLWLSSNSMVGVIYDANGVPVSTNRVMGNPYTTPITNALAFPLLNRSQPQLFIRDY